jgi:hypothetical protein
MGSSRGVRRAAPTRRAKTAAGAVTPKEAAVAAKGSTKKATRTPPPSRPRDAVRVDLPAAAVRVVVEDRRDGGPNEYLLLLAGLLLATAAGGSAVLGVAARQATGPA